MAIERLAEEIRKLTPSQREKLFKMFNTPVSEDEKRGGPNDPFSRLIGKVNAPKDGSQRYKEDLYGGKAPL
ncbi:hypothetical protein L9W92_18400 [Pelotomaculum terephthalicicum JT]|uniref:hypothetical protein n=1 Tax=Pelotomaculum terephthalicicum TaxID=206393 RepID=UPI001F032E52|nr:hypothetical protein [Pelotomaculum terephthalicicum]MCG9969966.1 hypothetical protein [Pelotomaculum terephthalicicum JT]